MVPNLVKCRKRRRTYRSSLTEGPLTINNIELFRETLALIENDDRLEQLTRRAIDETYVVEEGFTSSKQPHYAETDVSFEESLTLITAYKLADSGKKTAVLNFANPVEPRGGVLRGANAQEEYLCRASNLYPCLTGPGGAAYYRHHNELLEANQDNGVFLGTDTIIYSPSVTFFREDQSYRPEDDSCNPVQEYTDRWHSLNVITCAAPYFRNAEQQLPQEDLLHLISRRITNILESAIDNDVEALVLGAFGCGAFHNPPTLVAQAFQTTLLKDRYPHAFDEVVFAVKRTGWFCENVEAFEIAFQTFPPTGEYVLCTESNKRRFFS